MPGFFNSLTQALASYLNLLEVNPLSTVSEGQEAADKPEVETQAQETQPSRIFDFVSDVKERFKKFTEDATSAAEGTASKITDFLKYLKKNKKSYLEQYLEQTIKETLGKDHPILKKKSYVEEYIEKNLKEGVESLITRLVGKRIRERPEQLEQLAEGTQNIGQVDRARFQRAALEYIARAKARMQAATEDLAAGRISFTGYRRTMTAEIKRTILAQVILGIGGAGNLTDGVLNIVHQRIREDVRSLDEFIKEMRSRGRKQDDLFSTDSAKSKDVPPKIDSPQETLESAATNLDALDFASIGDTDEYPGEGTITGEDFETAGKFSEAAYELGQESFRTILADNANEFQLLEVRRLDEGSDNCEFCISWADKPMPPGELPPIGDPGCLGVRYATGGCHCTMDTATSEEVEEARDDA